MDDAEMHRRIVGYGVRVLGVSFRTEAPDSPVLRSLDNDGFFARKLRDTARPVLHVHVRRSQGGIWAPDEHGNIDAFRSGVGPRVHETCMIAHELGHAVLEIERRREPPTSSAITSRGSESGWERRSRSLSRRPTRSMGRRRPPGSMARGSSMSEALRALVQVRAGVRQKPRDVRAGDPVLLCRLAGAAAERLPRPAGGARPAICGA